MRGRYLRQLGLLAAAVTAAAILPVSASAQPTDYPAASAIV
ncbi:hypothetical protein [Nocardia cyriacigeorgica]|nr:hypothetical protein [Nocardia cyriacigeorgica]